MVSPQRAVHLITQLNHSMCFSPRQVDAYSEEDLTRFLEVICMFDCSDGLRRYVTNCISQRAYLFHPSKLIYFSTEYNLPVLFEHGFSRLCNIPLGQLTEYHCLHLKSSILAAYIRVMGRLDEHRHKVAAEPPEMQHAKVCQDLSGCSEDWGVVWWNGMGRLLLDARKPHSYEDAMGRFKTLKFGRVTEACKQNMFNNIIDPSIPAYRSRSLIRHAQDRLSKKLFPTT